MSLSFSISPSNEYLRLISFRMDWLDLPAVQGTLKSLQHQRNANQNHYEVPFHTSQNGCDPKVYK